MTEQLRLEIVILGWTIRQWEQGKLTKLETGETIAARKVAAWRRRIAATKRLTSPDDSSEPVTTSTE